jgi:hypothetical protein
MFSIIRTATGTSWGTLDTIESASAYADTCAKALNETFHVTGIVHVAHTIPAAVAA